MLKDIADFRSTDHLMACTLVWTPRDLVDAVLVESLAITQPCWKGSAELVHEIVLPDSALYPALEARMAVCCKGASVSAPNEFVCGRSAAGNEVGADWIV